MLNVNHWYNMSRILIVSALSKEIPNRWEGGLENYAILYTGVGKVNATYNLTKVLMDDRDDYDLVINYGTAGSKVYNGIVDCTTFIQRDMDATPLGFDKGETPFEPEPSMIDFSHIKNPIGKNLTCYTGDTFETNISQYDDVVDMEAYAIAKVCYIYGVDFVSFKYISDDGNPDDWKNFMAEGSKKFKEVLEIMKAD